MSSVQRRPRALVVAYDFPPHAAIGTMRTLRVVQQLARENWDVTVLTSDPRTYRPGAPVDEALLARVPLDVRVVRARAFRGFELSKTVGGAIVRRRRAESNSFQLDAPRPSHSDVAKRGVVGRAIDAVDAALAIPDHESAWLVPAIMRGLAISATWRPEVLYSSSPPWTAQLVTYALASALRCPWVADFRDPWGRAPWRGDRFAFAMNAARRLEHMVVRRADRVLFVAQSNRDEFAGHYGADLAAKFQVVANGCDTTEFRNLDSPAVPDKRFVLLHAGSLYAGRTPLPLFRAIAAAIKRGSIDPHRFRLRFLGAVALRRSDLGSVCEELGLEQVVEFAARVPRAESLRAMTSASGLLLLQPGHAVAVPGKVYEYFAAGRPIFAIAEGETAAIVRRSGIGVSVGPDDEASIVSALEQFIEMASQPITPPPLDLFDGTIRAAETVAILRTFLRGGAAGVDAAFGAL
jgi:glycosyltransferase involved in cell wall biosynthesis